MDTETANFWRVILQTIQVVITLIAASFGVKWFYSQRKTRPWAEMEISLNSIRLPDDRRFTRVTVTVTNKGKIQLKTPYARVEVREVLPFEEDYVERAFTSVDPIAGAAEAGEGDGREFPWPIIRTRRWGKCEVYIEPEESDDLRADFVLPGSIRMIEVHSFVGNPTRKGIGWHKSKLWSFEDELEIEKMNEQELQDLEKRQQADRANPQKVEAEKIKQQREQNNPPKKKSE